MPSWIENARPLTHGLQQSLLAQPFSDGVDYEAATPSLADQTVYFRHEVVGQHNVRTHVTLKVAYWWAMSMCSGTQHAVGGGHAGAFVQPQPLARHLLLQRLEHRQDVLRQ